MNVRVRYFAAFREATGLATEEVETTASSVAGLFDECAARHPSLRSRAAALVAVNDEMSDWDRALEEGDEVLLFPPVAGG